MVEAASESIASGYADQLAAVVAKELANRLARRESSKPSIGRHGLQVPKAPGLLPEEATRRKVIETFGGCLPGCTAVRDLHKTRRAIPEQRRSQVKSTLPMRFVRLAFADERTSS